MHYEAYISIQPVIGGFVVRYPQTQPGGEVVEVSEVATTVGKAIRIAKAATETFSLVKKSADDAAE